MEHPEKNKLKRLSLILGVIVGMLAIFADIVFVTYVFAKSDTIFSTFETFRTETVAATNAQVKINEKLMNQLETLDKRGLKNEKRLNRLEKGHRYPPIEWDDVSVPSGVN
jgi:hypothetical protein